jgi:choline dehydrogenase-like flavoprotein
VGSLGCLRRGSLLSIVDNPAVGENLQDHSITSINFGIADGQISGDIMRDLAIGDPKVDARDAVVLEVFAHGGIVDDYRDAVDVIATGVQIKTQDGPHEIKAKKEVILCAGSLNSKKS